jgi:hypothetical protein
MPDPLAGLPPRFLRTPEAARFLGLSGRTLEKHRTYGTGPKYRKIGGRVMRQTPSSPHPTLHSRACVLTASAHKRSALVEERPFSCPPKGLSAPRHRRTAVALAVPRRSGVLGSVPLGADPNGTMHRSGLGRTRRHRTGEARMTAIRTAADGLHE